jgi:hypothetical protein
VEKKYLKQMEKNENLNLNFIDVRDSSLLQMNIYTSELGRCFIKTTSMELAGYLKKIF